MFLSDKNVGEMMKTDSKLEAPQLFYGTAWKELQTQGHVLDALRNGFRAIDTANQRKHYFEEGVGAAIKIFLDESDVSREDLFIQSKFTFQRGQDHRLPYDPSASITQQVEQSLESSLSHLGIEYLDSLILHGPSSHQGINDEDREAWKAMESLVHQSLVKRIGLSNVSLEQLDLFYKEASLKPQFVQNRCYAIQGWDKDIRKYCEAQSIAYQGFSLLTANRSYLMSPLFQEIARSHGRSIPQITYRFALDLGMIALTGTTQSQHQKEALNVLDFSLRHEEIEAIESIAIN
jgi:diketogulonate reductase-like aldo/keto reductase